MGDGSGCGAHGSDITDNIFIVYFGDRPCNSERLYLDIFSFELMLNANVNVPKC